MMQVIGCVPDAGIFVPFALVGSGRAKEAWDWWGNFSRRARDSEPGCPIGRLRQQVRACHGTSVANWGLADEGEVRESEVCERGQW